MERQVERCCGLDVHRDTVAACGRIGGGPGQPTQQHVQTFRTTAGDLVVLRDWLAAHAVTHVAMESTGVYWKPVSARRSSKRLRGRVGSRTAPCRRDSDGCSGTAGPRKPWWRSPMRSYARRTMSSRITRSIASLVPITAIGSTANASRVARSSSSSARATA
jgi:hypothetical protein